MINTFSYFLHIPLRAEQVSKTNLLSEQGGINFTSFVISLPYKKIIKISLMDGNQLKNVCLWPVCLSVFRLVVPLWFLINLSDLDNIFLQKLEEMSMRKINLGAQGSLP